MWGAGPAGMESAMSSAHQGTEINSDIEVHVPLLLKNPSRALEPLLQKVRGWEEVKSRRDFACMCMYVHASATRLWAWVFELQPCQNS